MCLILAKGYKNTTVGFLTIKKSVILVNMKDVGSGIGAKNRNTFIRIVLKEIHGICETKNPSKEQVNEYKMIEREIYKKFTNLSKKN